MAIVNYYQCVECDLELVDDGRLFYYDNDSGETIDYLLLMSTVDLDRGAKIKGSVSETYCPTCDKYMRIYSIRESEIENPCETVRKGIDKHISAIKSELERLEAIRQRSKYTITPEEDYYVVEFPEWGDSYYVDDEPEMSREDVIKDALSQFHEEIDYRINSIGGKVAESIILVLDERGKGEDDPSQKVKCPDCGSDVNKYVRNLNECPKCGSLFGCINSACYD